MFSSKCTYRDTKGTLQIEGRYLLFKRGDGLLSRKEKVIQTIPLDAITDYKVEGKLSKRLVIFVDPSKVTGIPKHEFKVPDPDQVYNILKRQIEGSETVAAEVVVASTVSVGDEIEKLAGLRTNGVISEEEFNAFAERFKVATGEKVKGIVDAISTLSEEHKAGAMTEGNYNSAVWSLLDKMERER